MLDIVNVRFPFWITVGKKHNPLRIEEKNIRTFLTKNNRAARDSACEAGLVKPSSVLKSWLV